MGPEAKLKDGESLKSLVPATRARLAAQVPWTFHLHKSINSVFVEANVNWGDCHLQQKVP